jgi:hypothetical protein
LNTAEKLHRHTLEQTTEQMMANLLAEITANHEEMKAMQEKADADLEAIKEYIKVN